MNAAFFQSILRPRRVLAAVLIGAGAILVGILSIPLIARLLYDPDECRAYTEADIRDYVRQNLEPGETVCATKRPAEWTNQYSPYELTICDDRGQIIGLAEVYPDCGLERRR